MGELKSIKGISFSKVHLYRLMKDGDFPRSVAIGKNRVGFVEEEIDRWLEEKIAARDAQKSEAA